MKIITEYQTKLNAVTAEKKQTMEKIVGLIETINTKIDNVEIYMKLWEEKDTCYNLLSNHTRNQNYYQQKIQSFS